MFKIILHNEHDFGVRYYAEHQTLDQVKKSLIEIYDRDKIEVIKDLRMIEHLIYVKGIWRGSVINENALHKHHITI